MQKELDMYMKKIHNIRLYAIVHGLIEKHYTAFVNYPAATKIIMILPQDFFIILYVC